MIKMAGEFEVSYVDRCVVIKMAWGENRLNPDFISAMHNALDKAERYSTALADPSTTILASYKDTPKLLEL